MNPPPASPTVVSYRRVSTDEQGVSGLGLEAQQLVITAAVEHRGWTLAADYQDIASGKTTRGRQGLHQAIDHARRTKGVLVASKIDRISRDVIDFASLLRDAHNQNWSVLVLDLPMDTTTASGRMAALTMANVAEFERGINSERTSAALQAKKATGSRLGRPRKTPDATLQRVVRERDSGSTWQAIADRLNADRVPTTRGGALWRVGTVQRVYQSANLDAAAREVRHVVVGLAP
jgi:DNA invertase Pin-like site-specific DNA recombinase